MADGFAAGLIAMPDLFQTRTSYKIVSLVYSIPLRRVLIHFINGYISFTIVTAKASEQ